MNSTLSVSAIKNGTVIDHIPAGQALRIIHLLDLAHQKNRVTIGMNLPSKNLGSKDLIKIESRVLSDSEANEVVVFAPHATINVIENFKVIHKISTRLPTEMKSVFSCPNPLCISKHESVTSLFSIIDTGKQIKLMCQYCEKTFDRDNVKVTI